MKPIQPEGNDYSPEDTLDAEYYQALEELATSPTAMIQEAIGYLEPACIFAWNRGDKTTEDRIRVAIDYLEKAMSICMKWENDHGQKNKS